LLPFNINDGFRLFFRSSHQLRQGGSIPDGPEGGTSRMDDFFFSGSVCVHKYKSIKRIQQSKKIKKKEFFFSEGMRTEVKWLDG
jgi:hypothetical protein